MRSCIGMNAEAHVWMWIKLRFGLAGERFPGESTLYDRPKEDWLEMLGFPVNGCGDGCVNLRID